MQRLPVELLDTIFALCDDDIVVEAKRELRALCRSFAQSLSPRVFETVRLADFSRDAFDRLLALSQSHVARHVKTFEYKVIRHLGPGDVHAVDRLIDLDDRHSDGSAAPPPLAAVAQALFSRHQQFLAQADVLGTYYDIISLCRILPAFRSLRAIVISRFAQTPGLADNDNDATADDSAGPTRAFWAVVKALQICEYELESLTIDSWHLASLYSPDCGASWCEGDVVCHLSLSQSLQIRDAVEHLTSLTLSNIWLACRAGPGWRNRVRVDILSQCARLEHLCLEVADIGCRLPNSAHALDPFNGFDGLAWAYPDRYPDIQQQFPRLRSLELRGAGPHGARLSPEPMAAFCVAHRHTLRSLSLRRLWMHFEPPHPGPPPFEGDMARLASLLQLDAVHFSDLRQLFRGPPHSDEQLRVWRGWFLAKEPPP